MQEHQDNLLKVLKLREVNAFFSVLIKESPQVTKVLEFVVLHF